MEQRKGYQNIQQHSATGSLMPEFYRSMLPELLLQENLSQYPVSLPNSPSTNPSMPNSPATNPQSSIQALEKAISALKLSNNGIGGGRRLNSVISDSMSAHGRQQNDENYRFQNKNQSIDIGVGHRSFPDVGSERFGLPNPTALINEPRYRDGCFTSCSYPDQRHNRSYLHSKKEWSSPLNPNFPSMPCSNRYLDSLKFGFRANNPNSPMDQYYQRINDLSLRDLGEMIVPLAKEKNACRILQSKFENTSEDEIDMVLSVVHMDVGDLMKDEFGKLFVQKLIVVCNEDQRTRIVLSVTESPFHLMHICLDQFGTESLKKLLEYVSTPQQISLIMQALGNCAAALATDAHGHRIIQHCLLHFSSHENQAIINDITNNCFMVAKHRSGCCVVQTCVVHALPGSRERIISRIIANAVHLAKDPYGNYVLQHMLGLGIPEATAQLVRQLKGYYVNLSSNKFGSHVVEKCLTESREDESDRIIRELLRSPDVSMLLLDPFGNFVIQSALLVAKGHTRSALLNLIQMNAPMLTSNLYGKKLLDRFDRRRLHRV